MLFNFGAQRVDGIDSFILFIHSIDIRLRGLRVGPTVYECWIDRPKQKMMMAGPWNKGKTRIYILKVTYRYVLNSRLVSK